MRVNSAINRIDILIMSSKLNSQNGPEIRGIILSLAH